MFGEETAIASQSFSILLSFLSYLNKKESLTLSDPCSAFI
ncbi:hypothetical protein CWATWH0401_1826 [Crocosphaera watsonii WH 0401]|uniref:Uncharacterized protein n=2 Tax=Crocosphaera watsonii TaxID=263511 RepID=T2IXH6_CROWT|nr:hypothetical protein CWATWH0005_2001 [Crocosphaera watsonii WH 0005]CCQ63513.1 hypothetical protein CWATWH0401_1826 [Crocosphaera watsonii WH 0401]